MNIKDFKWTEKRFGTRFANILKKLGGLSKDGTDGSIEYKDDQGNVTKLVTDSNFSSLLAKNGLIEVKWQELKNKRDNGELIPGSLYRIIDYNCTTTQANTRSAGHQFDIVLLALSANKLAEEGWAMMHDNIYDVTFSDGVTKKCYIYKYVNVQDFDYNIVDVETKLGVIAVSVFELQINEENKTASTEDWAFTELTDENITYNYFQNYNLSAWKVWYCLDNDTARFAWADDSVIGDIENVVVYYPERTILGVTVPAHDVVYTLTNETQLVNGVTYFKLIRLEAVDTRDIVELLVDTKNINTETTLYGFDSRSGTAHASPGGVSIKSINYNTPPTEEGRGVIYRLIDEFNNDIKYDFKNIQFGVPLKDGVYDEDGVLTFVYTLTAVDEDRGNYIDISLSRAWDCKIGYYYDEQMNIYGLPPNICFNNASQIEIGNNCFHIILNNCADVSIGNNSFEVILTSIYKSSFGKQSANIRDLTPDKDCLNYGNGGVELATKNDLN